MDIRHFFNKKDGNSQVVAHTTTPEPPPEPGEQVITDEPNRGEDEERRTGERDTREGDTTDKNDNGDNNEQEHQNRQESMGNMTDLGTADTGPRMDD
ncbi:hypothetical protein KUCAC02_021828 [Chaenocephalus aceratus]|uniref:Uncharacterized protein n=1 Tax=Chaenocephalus aceratus TaxID=36190 RepID=A0ACB9XHA4_CHAAC|nr:hypothetical protein KUCAC02_021828 [Chaenocephalus aceratus]